MPWLLAISATIAIYGWLIEPRLLRLRRHFIKSRRLSRGVSLVFVSDFHASVSVTKRVARKVAQLQTTQKIDLIVLGGDFLHRGKGADKLETMFTDLTQLGLPVLAVLGNHDYSSFQPLESLPNETLLCFFKQIGITVLKNRSVLLLDQPGDIPVIEVLGVADLDTDRTFADKSIHKTNISYRERAEKLFWLIGRSGRIDCPTITVCHNPDGVYLPGQSSILCLSGHTHGGQVFWAPLITNWISRMLNYWAVPTGSRRFWSGTTVVNRTLLLVSRGVGTVWFRFGRTPEMHLVILCPEP